ncbi:MAG: sensor of ECF-type sigma factor [Flavobacterium sp.]|nr:sensor of ECF-type sigma factor [Flavobacterium sp.]
MKNYTLTAIILLFVSMASFAQLGNRFQDKKDQIKAMKVGYITNELNLTPDEASKFWPLFNAFEQKQQDVRKTKLKNYIDKSFDSDGIDKLSDKDANTLLTQMENSEEELYFAKKKFISSLKTILPAVKIIKLKKAEVEFSRKLLKQYRDRK